MASNLWSLDGRITLKRIARIALYGVVSLLVVFWIQQIVFGYPDPFGNPIIVLVGVPIITGLLWWSSRIVPAGVFGGTDEDAEEGVEPEDVEHGSVKQQHGADDEGDELNGGGDDERDEFPDDLDHERDESVGDAEHGEYVVTGTVTHGESSLQGVRVRAHDKDLTTEELLGESATTEGGQYRITYTDDDFAGGERESADLLVRVYNEVGTQIAESDVQFNVGRQTTVDIRIPDDETVAPSEYERLRSELEPLLDGRTIGDLSDEQIDFLTRELDLSIRDHYPAGEETLHRLRTAERLATATPFNVRVLYGLVRQATDVDRAFLTESTSEKLTDLVMAAVDANIIDIDTEGLETRLAQSIERLQRERELEAGDEIETTVEFVTNDDTPLAGLTVRVRDPADEQKQLTLTTAEDGKITFAYTVPPDADEQARQFQLTVINEAGVTLHEETKTLDPQHVTEITVPESSAGFSGGATLGELHSEGAVSLPDESDLWGVTLGAIQRAGGVENLDMPASVDDATRTSVNAIATLDLLADPTTAGTLVEHGYTDQLAIAETPLADFQSTMQKTLDKQEAATIHATAQAQTYLLDSTLVDRFAGLRNGTAPIGDSPERGGEDSDGN